MFSRPTNSIIGRGDGSQVIVPMTNDTSVTKGVGVWSPTRASGVWVDDYEGKPWYIESGREAYPGLRITQDAGVSTFHKTLGDGTPLFPQDDLTQYSLRQPSTVYTAGQKVWAMAADGLTYWWRCKAGGTSGVNSAGKEVEIITPHPLALITGTWSGGNAIINSNTGFTTTFVNGGVYKANMGLAIGKKYKATFAASVSVGTILLENITTGTDIIIGPGSTIFTSDSTGLAIGASNSGAVVTGLSLSLMEYNPMLTTGDSTDGTVTWEYGGLWRGTGGQLNEPASTNKCTCYGVPRADAYGTTLNSGTATLGKVYEIVTRTSIDWSLVATLLSGTANTVGAKYLVTGALTFTANDTAKECLDYVGTKAYHNGTAFQNPIANMTLSGDVAAVLSIVTDQTELVAAKLDGLTNGYKMYKCVSTGSTLVKVDIGGVTGNSNPHTNSVFIRVVSGTVRMTDSVGAEITIPVGSYVRATKAVAANAACILRLYILTAGEFYFLLPQLEEQPYATSIMPSLGATASRAATSNLLPVTMNVQTGLPITNLLLQSNAFTVGATWSGGPTNTSPTQNLVSPFGDATGWTLTDNSASVSEYLLQTITLTAGVYTLSCYVKKTVGVQSSYPAFQVGGDSSKVWLTTFDTTNGIATGWTGYTGLIARTVTASVVDINANWWRLKITFTLTAASTSYNVIVTPAVTATPNQSTGIFDVTSQGSVGICGVQLETGSAMSQYISTLTTTTTGSITSAPQHFSCIYTPKGSVAGKKQTLWVSRADANNYLECFYNGVIVALEKRTAGVPEYVTFPLTVVIGTGYLIDCYVYGDNTLGLFVNGVSAGVGLGSDLIPQPIDISTGLWTPTSGAVVDSPSQYTHSTVNVGGVWKNTPFLTKGMAYKFTFAATHSGGNVMGVYDGSTAGVTYVLAAQGTNTLIALGQQPFIRSASSGQIGQTVSGISLSILPVNNNSTTLAVVLGTNLEIGSNTTAVTPSFSGIKTVEIGRV